MPLPFVEGHPHPTDTPMNQKIAAGLLAVAASAVFAGSAHAQIPNITPFSVEVRGGAALPQGDFGEDLETGYTFGGNVGFQAVPMLGFYAGYTRSSFGIEDNGEDGSRITDQGFDAGVRFAIPTPLIPIDPFVKVGAIYHKLGIDGDGVDFEFDSELGFEVGAGLGFNILPKVQLTPAVTYSQFNVSDDTFDEEGLDLDVKNLRVDVGLRIRI